VRLETEYTGTLKPKSHPLRLIADALRAQSASESATPEDDGLWDTIKKASLTFDATESSSDAALEEPIPIFSNVFSDETIRLLSLIPVDVSDKDKLAPTFMLQSPISSSRSRSFSIPETPISPVRTDRGRSPPSRHAHVAPSLTANSSTAPTTASPETPTDWLQFSSNGFGTIPGSRDLVGTLWDNDVEVTTPPPAPLSRISSPRAHSRHSRHSRHSSLDSARTPVPHLPTLPATHTSKTTLIEKVKLDEAFIDFWTDSLLDAVLKHWPRFVLCQLRPLPSPAMPAASTPAWLVIEQRFVRVVPVASPVKEEVEVTVPPARPRPRPSSPRSESSRLSSAFSIASKRFTFFTGGSSDPKSPKEKTARLPQVGEFGEGTEETGEDATKAVERPEEARAKGSADQGAAAAVTTVGATVLAVAGAATAAAAIQGEITERPRNNGLPAGTAESAPSQLASVSAPKPDKPAKDGPAHSATTQNGLAHHAHHEYKSQTVPVQGPAGENAVVSSTVTSEPVKAETEPMVPGVEVETARLEFTSVPATPYLAGISEGLPPQAEAALEPSVVPLAGKATSAEEAATALVVPDPVVLDASTLEEAKSAKVPATKPRSVPVQARVPVPAVAIEELVMDDTAARVAEPEPVVEVKATEQDRPADEVAPDTERTHTFEVPAAIEAISVSEISEAVLPEGRAGELPTSDAAPIPASEKTAPEEDISTMREAQVATSTDSKPVIVDDSPTKEPEHGLVDDSAPAVQTLSVDEGQVADSVDTVEATGPLEEPAEVAGESIIKEDPQPVTIPERDDSILEEPKKMEATATASATEPPQVASDTAFSGVEIADSTADYVSPEAPASADEPDVGHADADVVTQPVEESLPTHVTHEAQDAVIEEQPTAEEISPIPETSTSESISAGGPATSHNDETDAAPAKLAVAESKALNIRVPNFPLTPFSDIPVVETTTSSEFLPPEVLEEPGIDAAPEPAIIVHDAAHSPANGSAELAVAHVEEANAEAVVLMNGNESNVSPIDDVSAIKVEPDVVEEPQATANDSESIVLHEEPSAPVPDASVSVVEETAPTAQVAEPVTEEPAPTATDTPVPAAEEPAPNEATTPEVVEAPVEALASTLVESDPVPEEATPATADAPVTDTVPAIEEPTLLLDEAVPVTAEAPTDPTSLPEEPAPITEEAVPAAEAPDPMHEKLDSTYEQSAPDTVETPAPDEAGPVVEEDSPIVEEDRPVLEEDEPVVEKEDPVVGEDRSVVEEDRPVVEEDDPVIEKDDPVMEDDSPVFEEQPPVLEEQPPILEDQPPVLEEQPLVLEEQPPVLEEQPPILEEQPLVLEEQPPVLEEHPPVLEEDRPALEEHPPVVEEQTPHILEEPPIVEENTPFLEDDPVVEGDDSIVEEDEPAAPEPAVENSAPPPEEGLPTSEPAATMAEETAPAAADSASSETTGAADATSW
jgi:hypothetical protein